MRLLIVVLSLLFMSVAVANEGAKESEAEAGAKYMEMTPKFTVNLAEPKKFLLINVQLLVEGAGTIAAVKKHMPALRHELIMLYSGRPSEGLQTMEQREALRQETTAVIRKTLEKMEEGDKGHGAPAEKEDSEEGEAKHTEGFKEAYFTEFLVD
ncbi:MAG: flagellar basal body-associated FliL family protein [Methylobacter sp.]|uniref:flagellar basal body-associated FliL family protein n=1 Tax=Methylobacter sp. TaxID=2051955 RepID=UPI00273056E3|nr:flagellar basal body-associated FliL family protein [Methylobacter sp.]MDP1664501.1 flagellar basal body-associated FliL family protein [Methylobacter sp.]MDP1970807.1 flagellar basal body-associated FliL family protein [Methylobacter sp.]